MGVVFSACGSIAAFVGCSFVQSLAGAAVLIFSSFGRIIRGCAAPLYLLARVLYFIWELLTYVFGLETFIATRVTRLCLYFWICFDPIWSGFTKKFEQWTKWFDLEIRLEKKIDIRTKAYQRIQRFTWPFMCIINLVLSVFDILVIIWKELRKSSGLGYQIFFRSIFALVEYFLAAPSWAIGNSISYTSAVAGSIMGGIISLMSIFIGLINLLKWLYNNLNPGFRILYGAALKTVIPILQEIAYDLDLTPGRVVSETNPFFSPADPAWSQSEFIIQSAAVPVYEVVYYILNVIVIISQVVALLFGEIANLVLTFSVNGIASSTCCFQSGGAFGCCVKGFLVSFVLGFVGIKDLLKAFNVNVDTVQTCSLAELNGVQCNCLAKYGGPFQVAGGCPSPTFSCVPTNNGVWKETETSQPIIGSTQVVTSSTGSSKNKQIACARWFKQQSRGLREEEGGGREFFVSEGNERCFSYCKKEEDGMEWKTYHCKGKVTFLGECGRMLVGDMYHQHLLKFKKRHPKMKIEVKKGGEREEKEEEEEKIDKLTFDKFREGILSIEKLPTAELIDCNFIIDTNSYYLSLYRTLCLLSRYSLINSNSKFIPTQFGVLNRILVEGGDEALHIFVEENNKQLGTSFSLLTPRNFTKQITQWKVDIEEKKKKRRQLTEKREKKSEKKGGKGRNLSEQPPDPGVPLNNNKYLCPDGRTYVLPQDVCTCPTPTAEMFQDASTIILYFFWRTQCFFVDFDIRELLRGLLDCYQEMIQNPEKDPTTAASVLSLLDGSSTESDFIYCPPFFPHFGYTDQIPWSYNEWVQENCAGKLDENGQITHQCVCPQYPTGVFDFYTEWFFFVPRATLTRLTWFWVAFQFWVTRLPTTTNYWNPMWQAVVSPITLYPPLLYAFDPQYALYGLSLTGAYFCAITHFQAILFGIGLLWDLFIMFFYLLTPFMAIIAIITVKYLIEPLTSLYYTCRGEGARHRLKKLKKKQKEEGGQLADIIVTQQQTAEEKRHITDLKSTVNRHSSVIEKDLKGVYNLISS